MRLVRVRIRNFRCYQTETSIDIGNLTVLVGKNDAGKSAVFDALAVFFGEAKLDSDDASVDGDKKDVCIICEFDDLPESLVLDADYPTTLQREYLLNEHGRLEIHKVYDGSLKSPKQTDVYAHALHPSVSGADDLLRLTNADLKNRAGELDIDTEPVDMRINTKLREAIRDAVGDLGLKSQMISLKTYTAKKIWDQLSKHLPCFALFRADRPSTDQDDEAQDPMKAAVKEALKQKEKELEELSKYVEHEVGKIAEATVAKIKEMDPDLASELTPQFRSPSWANVFKISLTGDGDIPINKRGSGIRRLILLNFFRAKAEQAAAEKEASSVIYAIEEPETSQHPYNQKMLMRAFCDLADSVGCQILLSTHTPVLARLVPSDCLRLITVQKDGGRSIYAGSEEEVCKLAAESLGVLPDHDVKVFVGVEGWNDIQFLCHISERLAADDESIPDLGALEREDTLIFFPLGGSNLALWKSRLVGLHRPEVYVVDRDTEPPALPKNHALIQEMRARPNDCKVFVTSKREMENYLHPDAIKAVRPEVDISFGDFDDVPLLVAQTVHEASESQALWEEVDSRKKEEKIRKAKRWLNVEAVCKMSPELLEERDPCGDIRTWLSTIGQLVEG